MIFPTATTAVQAEVVAVYAAQAHEPETGVAKWALGSGTKSYYELVCCRIRRRSNDGAHGRPFVPSWPSRHPLGRHRNRTFGVITKRRPSEVSRLLTRDVSNAANARKETNAVQKVVRNDGVQNRITHRDTAVQSKLYRCGCPRHAHKTRT